MTPHAPQILGIPETNQSSIFCLRKERGTRTCARLCRGPHIMHHATRCGTSPITTLPSQAGECNKLLSHNLRHKDRPVHRLLDSALLVARRTQIPDKNSMDGAVQETSVRLPPAVASALTRCRFAFKLDVTVWIPMRVANGPFVGGGSRVPRASSACPYACCLIHGQRSLPVPPQMGCARRERSTGGSLNDVREWRWLRIKRIIPSRRRTHRSHQAVPKDRRVLLNCVPRGRRR